MSFFLPLRLYLPTVPLFLKLHFYCPTMEVLLVFYTVSCYNNIVLMTLEDRISPVVEACNLKVLKQRCP